MLTNILLAVVTFGLAAFMVNRLHVLFTRHEIDVRGIHYSKANNPYAYWFLVGSAGFGCVTGAILFIITMIVLIGGF